MFENDLDFLLENFDKPDILMEGYVGKTKNLVEIEKTFEVMIKKYGSKDFFENARMKLNDCPEKKKIERLLEKEFGFASVDILIRPSALPNAMTLPMGYVLREGTGMPKAPTLHGQKWYDTSHTYMALLWMFTEDFNGQFTAGELTAMILHEVGHNFDITISHFLADILFWSFCISHGDILTPIFRQPIFKFVMEIQKFIDSIFPVRVILNTIEMYHKLYSIVAGPFSVFQTILGIAYRFVTEPISTPLNMLTGFGQEKFSDSFAVAYGYGPETISMMHKFDTIMMTTNKNAFIDTYTWIGRIAPTILLMLVDPHPECQTRAKLALEDLEKAANDRSIPPKMRAAIKRDYVAAKKTYDAFLQVEPDKQDAIALRLSRKFKEFAFNGKIDIRSYLYSASAMDTSNFRSSR
jgi:hypothetical protein